MDLKRSVFSYLESVRDWQGLVEDLEGIASPASAIEKATFTSSWAGCSRGKFLAGVKALKHFQDAYKLSGFDRKLGGGAQRLLGPWKAEHGPEAPRAGAEGVPRWEGCERPLAGAWGRALRRGEWERRRPRMRELWLPARGSTRKRAPAWAISRSTPARGATAAALVSEANGGADVAEKGRIRLRAVRVARRFAPEEAEGMLARAYAADPSDKQVAALYETILSEQGRFAVLEHGAAACSPTGRRSASARALARWRLVWDARWVPPLSAPRDWHPPARRSVQARSRKRRSLLLPEPRRTARKAGDWDRVLTLAEEAATRGDGPALAFVLAQAGTIAWRRLGNLIRARASFERRLEPSRRIVIRSFGLFEARIGETLKPAIRPALTNDGRCYRPRWSQRRAQADAATIAPRRAEAEPARRAGRGRLRPLRQGRLRRLLPASRARGAGCRSSRHFGAAAPARGNAKKTAKPYNEYVKTVLQLAGVGAGQADEKVALYSKAADLYVSKFYKSGRGREGVRGRPRGRSRPRPGRRVSAAGCTRSARPRRSLLGPNAARPPGCPPSPREGAVSSRSPSLPPSASRSPDVCIELHGKRCSRTSRPTARRSSALAGLYERAGATFEARSPFSGCQADATFDAAAKIQSPHQARQRSMASAFPTRKGRSTRGESLARSRPERSPGPRRSEEEVSDGALPMTSKSSMPRAASGTSSYAFSSSRRRRRHPLPRRSRSSSRLRNSGPTKSRNRIGQRRRTKRSSSSMRTTCGRPRSSHRSIRARTTPRRSPTSSRSSFVTSKIRLPSSSSTARWPRSTRPRSKIRRRPSNAASRPSS